MTFILQYGHDLVNTHEYSDAPNFSRSDFSISIFLYVLRSHISLKDI